jgi:DNA-binding transcriptional regulator YdaS (Cro superfamily)
MTYQSNALGRAKQRAGGAKALADMLGISIQAIGQWRKVPPLRVLQIEYRTGVPRHELRPDLYPAPDRQEEAS